MHTYFMDDENSRVVCEYRFTCPLFSENNSSCVDPDSLPDGLRCRNSYREHHYNPDKLRESEKELKQWLIQHGGIM